MAKSDATLEMLRQIDRKLDAMLEKLSDPKASNGGSNSSRSLMARAREIAAMTPAVRQTDSVELLHEDRLR
jgi:hypothetical protein